MEKINKNNYEAFYLDFLEGNLNEEDTALLLTFLDENPDLKLEDEELTVLETTSFSLDSSFKTSLKQTSFEEKITPSNIESFLIAKMEGLLSPQKTAELILFLAEHPTYSEMQKRFEATVLIPNHYEIFADKESLKRNKRVVLWPYIASAVAAGLAFLITMGNFNQTTLPVKVAKKDPQSTHQQVNPVQQQKQEQLFKDEKPAVWVKEENASSVMVASIHSPTEIVSTPNKTEEMNKNEIQISQLKTRPVHRFEVVDDNAEPIAAISHISSGSNNKSTDDQYTYVGFQEMNNPIAPLTNQLASMIKKEVDFRTEKPTLKHSGGFYLKIGKLEISRKVS